MIKYLHKLINKIRYSRLVRLLDAGGCRNYFVYNIRTYTSKRYVRIALKILTIPFTILRYFFPAIYPYHNISAQGREGLAVVVIVKNEAPYIEEWIKFHLKQGVSNIIIYDNESTDNLREVLKPYIDSGSVIYHVLKGRQRQVDAYNMAIADYGKRFRYMAVLDADEFLFVRNKHVRGGGVSLYEFVDEFMKTHPKAGGLAVNFLTFGSSGHITRPKGGVLKNYTRCAVKDDPENLIIKTILDPVRALGFSGVNFPFYVRGYCNLDENGEVVPGHLTQKVICDKIRINHYFLKSQEDFMIKINRGKADHLDFRTMKEFDKPSFEVAEDTEILSHI